MIKHKRAIIFSGLVLLGKVVQGLFLHPYQTMQGLVKEKVFVWLSFIPLFFLFLSFIVSFFAGKLIVSCDFVQLINWQLIKQIIIFIFNWWLVFLIFWQALLIYLLFRFALAFWGE